MYDENTITEFNNLFIELFIHKSTQIPFICLIVLILVAEPNSLNNCSESTTRTRHSAV